MLSVLFCLVEMSQAVYEADRLPVPGAGVIIPASIDAATSLTLPTQAQLATVAGTIKKSGTVTIPLLVVEAVVQTEGANTSRWLANGGTVTTANGLLVASGAALSLRGFEVLKAFRIIGTAVGNKLTYQFFVVETRR